MAWCLSTDADNPTDVKEFISDQPQNGTAKQDLAGDPITYTPNANFVGTDFIEIQSFDDFGFGSDKGVVAVTVTAPPNPPTGRRSAALKKCKKTYKKALKRKRAHHALTKPAKRNLKKKFNKCTKRAKRLPA